MKDELKRLEDIKLEFEQRPYLREHSVKWLIQTVEEQQKEIEELKAQKQILSHYKFMYEQARY